VCSSDLQNLLGRVDGVLVGGGMANTFLKAQGLPIGGSLYEESRVAFAKQMLEQARERKIPCLVPVDVAIADRFDANANSRVVPVGGVPPDWRILDIGPQTIQLFRKKLADGKLVLWNGPMGVFEFPKFAAGTKAVAEALGAVKGTTVVGGGETSAAVYQLGLANLINHVSTGGGAALEFLAGSPLPGVDALIDP
jgi:phosphoglycerate kinase